MHKSFWSLVSSLAALFALAAASANAGPPAEHQRFCRSGKQIRKLAVSLKETAPPPAQGIPLDRALQREMAWVARAHREASDYFLDHEHASFSPLREKYTLLLPDSVRLRTGIGDLIGFDTISSALKYREALWKSYIEKFTMVKMAPSRDPYTLKFEVSLDLNLFCRYGHEVTSLVTRN